MISCGKFKLKYYKMTTLEHLEKVDDTLAHWEDYFHGQEGIDVTEARFNLNKVKQQLIIANGDLGDVSGLLPSHNEILEAAIEYDRRDLSNEPEGATNEDYIGFKEGAKWLRNFIINKR